METKKVESADETEPTEEEIGKILEKTIILLKDKKANINSISKSESFIKFQEILNQRHNKSKQSLIKTLLSYWDIYVYIFLIIIFTIYLGVFLSVYTSSDVNYKAKFNRKINLFYKWSVAKWLHFNEFTDLTKEECALMLPDFTNSITRPIDDCSMCVNLTEIKRVKRISKKEFIEKYAYTGVPVVITDAIDDWTALKVFNYDFLKKLYSNLDEREYQKRQSKIEIHKDQSSAIMETFNSIIETDEQRSDSKITCQFFPYKTKFQNLLQVFEMEEPKDGKWDKPWYVGWSNCNNYASKILRKHYRRPYFLPDESEMSRTDWIFMGTPGYGANLHIDDVNNPTWQAQISGIKYWTFKPPAECLTKCPLTLNAEVKPGEIIIFDSNRWFHSTLIKGDELSLAICSEYD